MCKFYCCWFDQKAFTVYSYNDSATDMLGTDSSEACSFKDKICSSLFHLIIKNCPLSFKLLELICKKKFLDNLLFYYPVNKYTV